MINYITEIDFSILYWIQENLRCAFLDVLMPFFSFIQEGGGVWIAIAVAFMFSKKTRYFGFAILIAMAVDTLITEYGIKLLFARVRPCNLVRDVNMIVDKPQSYSFPSNHTASAFAGATALFVTSKKKWAVWGFVLSGIIAFSRLYLFVHFPSDVIVGMIVGSIIGVVVCVIMDKSGFKKLLLRKNIIEV